MIYYPKNAICQGLWLVFADIILCISAPVLGNRTNPLFEVAEPMHLPFHCNVTFAEAGQGAAQVFISTPEFGTSEKNRGKNPLTDRGSWTILTPESDRHGVRGAVRRRLEPRYYYALWPDLPMLFDIAPNAFGACALPGGFV